MSINVFLKRSKSLTSNQQSTHRQLVSDIFGPNFFISNHTWNLFSFSLKIVQCLIYKVNIHQYCCFSVLDICICVWLCCTFSSSALSLLPSLNPRMGSFLTSTAAHENVLNLQRNKPTNHDLLVLLRCDILCCNNTFRWMFTMNQ